MELWELFGRAISGQISSTFLLIKLIHFEDARQRHMRSSGLALGRKVLTIFLHIRYMFTTLILFFWSRIRWKHPKFLIVLWVFYAFLVFIGLVTDIGLAILIAKCGNHL